MLSAKTTNLKYDEVLESALIDIESRLKGHYGVSKRTIGLLLLQGDTEIESQVREQEGSDYKSIQEVVSQAIAGYSQSLNYIIALRQQQEVKRIISTAVTSSEKPRQGFAANR